MIGSLGATTSPLELALNGLEEKFFAWGESRSGPQQASHTWWNVGIEYKPAATTQPAGSRGVIRSAREWPQVYHPPASARPTPGRDPVSGSTGELHNDEHIENTKSDRVLHEKVTSPHGLGLVLQEASPGLGIAGRVPFDHVSPDGRGGMADGELYFQL